jgi:cellulose synthase/poly-beta-1,6-N-acetylglucosamine synthase-like glycosyltransferase
MALNLIFFIAYALGAATAVYLLFLAICGKYIYRNRFTLNDINPSARVAILVPGYKEDGIILSTSQNLQKLDYPAALYDIYIIADSFQPSTLDELYKMPVHVLEVSFSKSTKTKALNAAFDRISKPYDLALVLDADNIPSKDFLKKVNAAYLMGAKAIQGRRVAKNLDTSYAVLDACSEGINNHLFRKGANACGMSSSIIGSGMAFEYETVKNILAKVEATGGFDKVLQLEVIKRGIKIEYLHDALVFDEKVNSSHAFRQQRKRWVSSQFIYLKKFFPEGIRQLFKGNISYFDLAIVKNLILPRAFLFVLFPLLFFFSFSMGTGWVLASLFLGLAYIASLWLSLPVELLNRDLVNALWRLPQAIGLMVGTLFGIKKANQTFIHTIHTKTEINNPLFNEHAK